MLGRAFPDMTGVVAYSHAISLARVSQIEAAFPNASRVVPANIVQQMRLIKYPEEIVLHREAARISDEMVMAGVGLIAEAMASGGTLPSEIEIRILRVPPRHEDHV
ncbi:hypothetical protein N8D56_22435 [Devosia sp. A8/3-2]|nr:hypothetical protein N8D56_22435 [Devosia sp. A8/3-2]